MATWIEDFDRKRTANVHTDGLETVFFCDIKPNGARHKGANLLFVAETQKCPHELVSFDHIFVGLDTVGREKFL